jgi:hypothetical protein
VLAAGIGGIAIMSFWPGAAAQNIDRLRDIIGDAPVAQLETAALNLQDHAQQLEYQVGLVKPAAPWSDSNPAAPNVASVPTPLPAGSPTAPLPSPTALPDSATPTPLPSPTPLVDSATESPSPTPLADSATEPPSPSVTPLADSSPAWSLPPLAPLGNVPGSGQWSPYLRAADGVTVVAYRTFLNPDPGRPYATAAIVAFDLGATHLHFVLGSVEPWSGAPQPSRTGMIPAADLRAGVLLATFNGGFKARHGHWGAMADGITALPPIDRAATVAMYGGGSVRIGEWGTDIVMSDAMAAWRQNGYLLIHNTLISPDTTQTTSTWGLTIDWKAITWRSALGQSADRRVLYYVAGPELDVNTLTTVMAETGAADALELDVNNFWVNFAAIRGDGPNLAAEPLLPQMTAKVDRYLSASARDFFYVTAGSQQQRP